jgi:type IV pilus assembly protein PilN
MKITLNLATRPYADQGPAIKRLRIGMAVLAGLLVLLGLGLLHFHQRAMDMRAQEAKQDRAVARLRAEEEGYQRQMQQPLNAKVLQQAGFLNQLFEEKAFSWTAAMEDLESVLPAGVQVTAIEPVRAKDGRLTLRLRVSGLRERSVEMVRNMERSPRFAAPRISAENTDTSENPQGGIQPAKTTNRVNFDLLAEYNPATLEERRAGLAAQKRSRIPKAATQPAPAPKPAYIPPLPQPARPGGAARPIRRVPGVAPTAVQEQQDEPTGYDPSGLKNHDRNRVPPPPPDGGQL